MTEDERKGAETDYFEAMRSSNVEQRKRCESLYSSIVELRAVSESRAIALESLCSSARDLHAATKRRDGQIEALLKESKRDGERIRTLLRIAEIREEGSPVKGLRALRCGSNLLPEAYAFLV